MLDGEQIASKIQGNVFDNNDEGVLLQHNTSVYITENTFRHNMKVGLHVSCECSAGQIHHNAFLEDEVAVLADSGARPVVASNSFARCRIGVMLTAKTNSHVQQNHFTDGTEIGVMSVGGTGEVCHNVFSACSVAGVAVEQQGAANVFRNLFAHNKESELSCGVLTRNGGHATFTENDFHENSVGVAV